MKTALAASTLAAALLLSGCMPGSQGYIRNMESYGNLRVEPSNQPGYDYAVYVRNVLDIGYDPSNKATRDQTALQMLKTQCPAGTVVGETVINTGEWMGGRQSATYIIQVKCSP